MSLLAEKAKTVLMANESVPYGIFGVAASSKVFPPHELLNEFLAVGYDPCDQDQRMASWQPFALSPQEYSQVKEWWVASHDGAHESSLSSQCWQDWVQELLQ